MIFLKKIQSKFIFIYTLLSVVFTSSLLAIVYYKDKAQLYSIAKESSIKVTELYSRKISSNIDILQDSLKIISKSSNLLEIVNKSDSMVGYKELNNISPGLLSSPKIINGDVSITIIHPVEGSRDLKAIGLVVDLESIFEFSSECEDIYDTHFWISNSENIVLAHRDRSKILNRASDEMLKSYSFLEIDNTNGWRLYYTLDKSFYFKKLENSISKILLIALLMLIVYIIVIIKTTERITKPINTLTKAVKDSTNKNFNRISFKSSDYEVNQLITSYNMMTSEISRYTKGLEVLVDKRTHELNRLNKKLSEDNENLYNIATKDPLTGLLNRRAVNQVIEKEMHRYFRYNSPVSMLILDIDHFKNINDTYGHDTGDKVLVDISEIIINNSRGSDTVSRWGGEEFLILAPHTSLEGGRIAGENIRKAVEKFTFDKGLSVTISIGISTYELNESFDTWFKRCDRALYSAKSGGRNQVVTI